jgi:predicted DNA-binding transcriptional regulator YafY
MPRGDQLVRQWRLIQLIDRAEGVGIDEAVRELGRNRRTVFRDLEVLQEAGFPIFSERADDGRRSVWRVVEEFRRSLPLKLTLAEVAALVMSRELLAHLGASLLGPSVTSAWERIAAVLSRDAVQLLDRMRETVGVRALGAKLEQPVAEHLPALHTALLERRSVRMRYYSASRDAQTDRVVDPYRLTYFDGGLYLIGRCHLRQGVRVFAAERIRSVQLLRTRFEPPRDFDAQGFLDKAWGILQGDLVAVRVVFARSVARYIKNRQWHPSQQFRELSDGRLELRLKVADTLEVRRWILGYGAQAEVMEPASMREAIRLEAEQMVRRLAPLRRPLRPAAPARAASGPDHRYGAKPARTKS